MGRSTTSMMSYRGGGLFDHCLMTSHRGGLVSCDIRMLDHTVSDKMVFDPPTGLVDREDGIVDHCHGSLLTCHRGGLMTSYRGDGHVHYCLMTSPRRGGVMSSYRGDAS